MAAAAVKAQVLHDFNWAFMMAAAAIARGAGRYWAGQPKGEAAAPAALTQFCLAARSQRALQSLARPA